MQAYSCGCRRRRQIPSADPPADAARARFLAVAQDELGRDVGVPNDMGFENFDWRSVGKVREALEGLGIGYGAQSSQPGRFYEYPGDPIARGVGTPVSHTKPM